MNNEMRAFVDDFCDCYNRSGLCTEEDQKLPPAEVLEEICQTLVHLSCMREEGRYSSFRVCFLSPDSELLGAYIYAHALHFEKPVEFNLRAIHKLAPALNADMSYLMLDLSEKPFKAVGILGAYTTWEKIMTKEISKGIRMPLIPNILVLGPGELEACFGETSLVSYRMGECVYLRTDTFTSTLVAKQLENGTHISEADRLQFLYQVLWQAHKFGQGGHIFIVPSAESCEKYTSYKYKMYCPFPTRTELGRNNDREIYTYANLIAKFTMVDGAVVLTKDLELIGFGAETYVDRVGKASVQMCFVSHDDQEDNTKKFNDNGMRHRACYQFCNEVEGAVGIILSHDGVIKACTKHDGKVVVYDHVGLPLDAPV